MQKPISNIQRKENLLSKLRRFVFNFFPAYRRTGGRICFLSHDWQEVHIKLDLNRGTKNLSGSVFGGSIYGALDPIFMVQLMKLLGKEYIVWDKSANIRFLKPIRKTVVAKFIITDELLADIKRRIDIEQRYTVELKTAFLDKNGIIYADVVKTIYIADVNYYNTVKKKIA